MTTGALLFDIALVLVVLAIVVRPFVAHQAQRRRTGELSALVAEKEALLDQIKQLEFDHDTGKVPDEAYEPLRASLLENAAAVLRELDARGVATIDTLAGEVDEQIEQAISQRRRVTKPVTPLEPAPRQAQPVLAAAPAGAPATNAQFCTQCGAAVDTDDRFCARCGHQL